MMSPKRLIMAFAICMSTVVFAQQQATKTDVNQDIDLVVVYEAYVAEGYGTPEIYKKLANAHYFEDNYSAAISWYEKLFETETPIKKVHAHRYKQSLKALKRNLSANPYLTMVQEN